ncbi:hypothetical protein PCCS19_26330 [Paenibacillus sp. CCS19]|uniref:hypothetical protein n=1 Tax=Paenibacillus sp. CCS19 TaxID=3158387 RepID=UPI002567F5F0|nr:hypothetical protein [Paenibacillus cellulosilyticus]GMK39579.1 hypothetical protein PCCS19_26330 [Paenibacillus cellulosilyticus]
MRRWKIVGLVVVLLLGSVIFYFLNTRIWIDKFEMNGDTIIFENHVYVSKGTLSESDTDNLGKKIGVAADGKRTLTDYIWPVWIYEYKDDREQHNRIFAKGLMDLGTVYLKQAQQ